ncbi:MAG: D-alanyl-D-alanine carboxypeptidase family protein [Blautia sp.]|jgi:D-alanyl-D-alanine carboxypeptidase (penicillin-binding protein 5/6)
MKKNTSHNRRLHERPQRNRRAASILAVTLCLIFLLTAPVQAAAIQRLPGGTDHIKGWPKGPKTASLSAVLMEADTGIVVYNKKMNEKRYPASTTKIMTALLTIENCKLDDQVTFTQTGINEIYSNNSNIGMQVGEVLTVEQCLYALLLESANEVATQLAEHIGGTVAGFVDMMNKRAEELGCTGTHFNNASGLPDENHYTTAYDLALILQECVKNETFLAISGTYQYELAATNLNPAPRPLTNHHPLIQPGPYHYDGILVGKTGYTDMSKNTLVSAAKKDDTTYVAVTLGSDIGGVINDTTNLFNYGFDNFQKIQAEDADILIDDGTLLVPKDTKRSDLTYEAAEENGNIRRTYRFGQKTYVGTALLKETEKTTLTTIAPSEIFKTKVQELKETKSVVPYIVIGVLCLLILLGIAAIISRIKSRKKRR